MNKSDSIGQLALALSKFQGEVKDAPKSKKSFKGSYAPLEDFLSIARPLCLKYELAVSQLCVSDPEKPHLVGVETLLTHSSGEWISSTMYMPVEQSSGSNGAQDAGKVISYCRRYALGAMLNMTQVNEDTDAAIEEDKPIAKVEHKVAAHVEPPPPAPPVKPMTPGIILREELLAQNVPYGTIKEWLTSLNATACSDLNTAQVDLMYQMLNAWKKENTNG